MNHLFSALGAALVFMGCGVDASPGSAGEQRKPKTQVSEFQTITGTQFLIASEREQSGSPSPYGSSYGRGIALNYLFHDLESATARWLFSSNSQRILYLTSLAEGDGSAGAAGPAYGPGPKVAGGTVRAFLYLVVSQDTNGDGDLDDDDVSMLAVSDPGGRGHTVLAPAAERFLGAFWTDGEHALAVYEIGGTVQGVEFNVDDREVTRRKDFPAAPGSAPAV